MSHMPRPLPLQELLALIDLDVVAYDMFELPPLSEYEVYMKNFGSDDTRQVSILISTCQYIKAIG